MLIGAAGRGGAECALPGALVVSEQDNALAGPGQPLMEGGQEEGESALLLGALAVEQRRQAPAAPPERQPLLEGWRWGPLLEGWRWVPLMEGWRRHPMPCHCLQTAR